MSMTRIFVSLIVFCSLVVASGPPAFAWYDKCPARPGDPPPTYADGHSGQQGAGEATDFLMREWEYAETVLQQWCVNAKSKDAYVLYKINGNGKPFKFIAKCMYRYGYHVINAGNSGHSVTVLTNKTITVRVYDKSAVDAEGNIIYQGSNYYWEYKYYPELGSVVAEQYNDKGELIRAWSGMPPEQGSDGIKYDDLLPSTADTYPILCSSGDPAPMILDVRVGFPGNVAAGSFPKTGPHFPGTCSRL